MVSGVNKYYNDHIYRKYLKILKICVHPCTK